MATPDIQREIRLALDAGRFDQALTRVRGALVHAPDDPELLGLAGLASLGVGHEAGGIALLEAGERRAPDHDCRLRTLSRALGHQFDRVRPAPGYDAANHVCWPEWVNAALVDLERLVAARPRDAEALVLVGRFHKATGNDRRAVELARACIARHPGTVEAVKLLGESLDNLHQYEEAREVFQRAAELAPDDRMIPWLIAMRQLSQGRFSEGWRGYEARHDVFGWGTTAYPFPIPLWNGEDLAGRSILVHGEQGFGDEIMFASIVPEIIECAGRVLIATSPSLASLFVRSFPGAVVYPHNRSPAAVNAWKQGKAPPVWSTNQAIDCQAPIGSLACQRRNRPDAFPGTPYLITDADKVARFEGMLRDREDGAGVPRIGINLTANLATGLMGLEKSVPERAFQQVFNHVGRNARFVSLHIDSAPTITVADGVTELFAFPGELIDFDATAALIECLDAVVTTDTAVAHLAGALGKPTLVMLKYNADWRYGEAGTNCLWYHSMHLARQTRRGAWHDVMSEVNEWLTRRITEASSA